MEQGQEEKRKNKDSFLFSIFICFLMLATTFLIIMATRAIMDEWRDLHWADGCLDEGGTVIRQTSTWSDDDGKTWHNSQSDLCLGDYDDEGRRPIIDTRSVK